MPCGTRRSSPAHEADKEQAAHPKWVRRCRLSINPGIHDNGKEECARETQEGCPAPLKLTVFQNFLKF